MHQNNGIGRTFWSYIVNNFFFVGKYISARLPKFTWPVFFLIYGLLDMFHDIRGVPYIAVICSRGSLYCRDMFEGFHILP